MGASGSGKGTLTVTTPKDKEIAFTPEGKIAILRKAS